MSDKPNMFPKPSFQSKTPLEVLYEEREELRNEVMCLKLEVAGCRAKIEELQSTVKFYEDMNAE